MGQCSNTRETKLDHLDKSNDTEYLLTRECFVSVTNWFNCAHFNPTNNISDTNNQTNEQTNDQTNDQNIEQTNDQTNDQTDDQNKNIEQTDDQTDDQNIEQTDDQTNDQNIEHTNDQTNEQTNDQNIEQTNTELYQSHIYDQNNTDDNYKHMISNSMSDSQADILSKEQDTICQHNDLSSISYKRSDNNIPEKDAPQLRNVSDEQIIQMIQLMYCLTRTHNILANITHNQHNANYPIYSAHDNNSVHDNDILSIRPSL